MISCNGPQQLGDSDHEEADTRIVLHVQHALQTGARSLLVRTVDTDVVVILVGKYHDLVADYQDAEIWVAFGMGRNFFFLSIDSTKKDQEHYQSSMHLLVQIPHLRSMERVKRRHGKPGKIVKLHLPWQK